VAGGQRDRARRRGDRPAPGARAATRFRDGPRVRRGALRHPSRRRDRGQRDPRGGDGDAQLPLRARSPPEEATSYLRALVPGGATLEIASAAPPGRVVVDSPLVRALRDAGDLEVEPKQAWTNVADFTANGIDAVNFGPGHTAYAHRSDELVEIAALVDAYEVLHAFLAGTVREDTA
jgi:hypothetical protein